VLLGANTVVPGCARSCIQRLALGRERIARSAEAAAITAVASSVALLSHVARLLLGRAQEPMRRSDGDEASFEGALTSVFSR
jgi:hypothetical protein